MDPIVISKIVQYRAILAKAEEVKEKREDAEVHISEWYDSEPPISGLVKAAKEKGCDLIQIETVTTDTKVFEVKI